MTPQLWYDAECPVCVRIASVVTARLGERIEAVPSRGAKEPKYVDANSTIYKGAEAIARMNKDFPELSGSLSFLPESWRNAYLQTGYGVASLVRKVIKTGGCNCGSGQ